MAEIALIPVTDWAELGDRWRELEARSDCSFFQSWTWTGCLAEERFTDPVLLQAEHDGRVVALALFNRHRGRLGCETLWLGESGVPALDSVFIEHNGLLHDIAMPATVFTECVQAMLMAGIERRYGCGRRVVLSGVDDAVLAVLHDGSLRPWVRRSRPAPHVDLARIRRTGGGYLDALSANARYQVRRSNRAYERLGEVTVRHAGSEVEAYEFLAALVELHQATWVGRGKPGAFANPHFIRFHRELIRRGLPRGEIELLRITAGEQIVGFLYNYRFRFRVLSYQSGFDYADIGPHRKPGLTCHHWAIERALQEGMNYYDFLAGEDRYKRSLSNAEVMLHWAEIGAATSLRRYVAQARDWLGGLRGNGRRGRASHSTTNDAAL